MDRDWTRSHWATILSNADRLSPELGDAVLRSLRQVFPPELVDHLRMARHPLVAAQFTRAGRLRLLELGLALACLAPTDEDIGRLRDVREHQSTVSEFCAALMFARSGARIVRPRSPGTRCEFVATFPSGERLAVEVKLPDQSEREARLALVESGVIFPLLEGLSWVEAVIGPGRATIHFSPLLEDLWLADGVDQPTLLRHVSEAVARVKCALSEGSMFGTIDLGPIGALELRAARGVNRLEFNASMPPPDNRQVARRLMRNALNKALRQTTAAGAPGIVVLDIQRDPLARNGAWFLARWAQRKESLAAVMLIDRCSMSQDGRMYGNVDVLPGPEFDKAWPALSTMLDTCDAGHLHYNPLCTPTDPCPCMWRPRLLA